tara:strand:- start:536 stop:1759 length:1224 start_codon:yes stop_codon:yes gene_type:complete
MTERNHFLLLKTHRKTGLKYLCYTTKSDPFKYKGSGKRWRLHLRKHGADLETKILGVFDNEEQLKELGRHYSKLWDVVKSDEFANLRVEEGDGGDTSTFIDYKNMKPMPRGKWKRADLTRYNKTRVNPKLKELICPWCGEKGYGYQFKKKHLTTTHKTEVDPKRYNCKKNPHRILNYNEKIFFINGEELTINDISDRYSLPRTTIQNRLFQGQTIEEIIDKPLTTDPRYQFEGQDLTINEIAKLLGVSRKPIEKLIKKNQSIDQYKKRLATLKESKDLRCEICGKIVTDKRQIHSHFENCKQTQIEKHRNAPKHLYKGEQKTIEEICENEGINPATLKDRLRKGKTLSEAVKMGVSQKEKQINFRDKQYSVSEFCKEFGISNTTFHRHRNSYELPELIKKFAKVKSA